MERTHADGLAILVVVGILVIGMFATWQAYQQWVGLAEMGNHMRMSPTVLHGTHPLWYLFGTILVAVAVGGIYLGMRGQMNSPSVSKDEQVTESEVSVHSRGDPVVPDLLHGDTTPDRPIVDFLPDDEKRILRPVLESPGLTQIELRDRSDFSKSKVSQTVTDLEKRGLLYREPQGRTYRVYPSKDLEQNQKS